MDLKQFLLNTLPHIIIFITFYQDNVILVEIPNWKESFEVFTIFV